MKNRGILPVLALAAVALLQACATPDTAPVGHGASAQPAATAADAEAALAADIAEAAKGYQRVERDGQSLFCKRERQTGSNLSTTVCLTEADLRAQVENAKKFRDDIMQQGRRCSRGPACQPD